MCVGESRKLAGLVLRTVHGLIDLERGRRMRDKTGTGAPVELVELLLTRIAHAYLTQKISACRSANCTEVESRCISRQCPERATATMHEEGDNASAMLPRH